MAEYVFPAIFTKEENGYSIVFPDFDSCYTSAEKLTEGMTMASDVLCLTLYGLEEEGRDIPKPSDISDLKVPEGSFATLVFCDTIEYRKFYDNRSVKKTLTIPSWLNTMAERHNINFSTTLQTALKKELNIQ